MAPDRGSARCARKLRIIEMNGRAGCVRDLLSGPSPRLTMHVAPIAVAPLLASHAERAAVSQRAFREFVIRAQPPPEVS